MYLLLFFDFSCIGIIGSVCFISFLVFICVVEDIDVEGIDNLLLFWFGGLKFCWGFKWSIEGWYFL